MLKKIYLLTIGFFLLSCHDDAINLKNSQIAEELALPPVKIHCSILAEDAIKAAVDDYRNRHSV